MQEFQRSSYNDQHEIVADDETFRRYICGRLDGIHDEVLGAFWFSFGLGLLQTAILAVILWRVW